MARKKHSKESIILLLQNLAARLGKPTLTKKEIGSEIPPSALNRYFGSVGNALEAAGLQRRAPAAHFAGHGDKYSDDELLSSLHAIETKLGHEPNYNENQAYGQLSAKPFRKRFGKWDDVLAHYRKWKAENPSLLVRASELGSAAERPLAAKPPHAKARAGKTPGDGVLPLSLSSLRKDPGQLYGEPIDFRGLRHAPINEQGVVYLFGMVSRELGFYIEALQQGFPDCEGKFLYDKKKNLWAKARIEFEFCSSNFQEHGHDASDCDFIVCWIDDWPECPINVIELRSEILKLPST